MPKDQPATKKSTPNQDRSDRPAQASPTTPSPAAGAEQAAAKQKEAVDSGEENTT
ncbi:MAG: hypothetical protein JO023_09905 [Chloroflexi bacterium]|nr:hypothetical protein [Chloroflexota bacterium]